MALTGAGDDGVEIVSHKLVVGDEDTLAPRPPMADVVGPCDDGTSPDQEIGHVLIATEMLPVPMALRITMCRAPGLGQTYIAIKS